MSILASSYELPSAASAQANGVTLSALCKDSNNNAVSGVTVTFASTAGLVEVTQASTDASGTALAVLTTGGDPTNHSITVTASATNASGGLSTASIPIIEQGTNLLIAGPLVVGSTTQVSYTVTLVDSSGNGIPNSVVTLASSLKNSINPSSVTTGINGQAQFTYTGTNTGSDSVTGSDATFQANANYSVSVSATSLTFPTSINYPASIPFNTAQQVEVLYVNNGAPVPNATINFSATRGTLTSTATCNPNATGALSATTNSSGDASVYLCASGSQGAGGTIISAAVSGGGPSATPLALQFSATTPALISVEATPSTIAPSGTSVVKAVVYDASNNLVQGELVDFVLSDPTGGTLSAASGVTDQSGSVSVTYQATSVSSSQGGVQISATVNGTNVSTLTPAKITVGGQALRITLGTGNTISVLDQTRYQMPYAVLVTDSAGNPVPDVTFNLSMMSVSYQKGEWVLCASPAGQQFGTCTAPSPPIWFQDTTVPSTDPHFNDYPAGEPPPYNILFQFPFGCLTEDPNNTGIYNVALDYNDNGVLDPGAVASVPSTVALDSTGSAQFFITYPKDHAQWVEVLLTGIASVSGTETTATAEFVLPILASDVTNSTVPPPGQFSPYGIVGSCASSQ
jgi:hypothetical protein